MCDEIIEVTENIPAKTNSTKTILTNFNEKR